MKRFGSLPTVLTRRETLSHLGVMGASVAGGVGGTPLPSSVAWAQEERKYEPLNRFPRMVQEAFVANVRRIIERKRKRMLALSTREEAEAYVESVRAAIRECFGPEPERTPLQPRITGMLERDGYRIENVIFESRPGFPVTANFYLPTGIEGKIPGVVGTCGHSSNGKAETAYQSFAQGLAKLGIACLIYDPIGQGERLQYANDELKSTVGVGVREHLYAGNQQFLVGEFLGAWRAWDGVRALDYLLSREEIDATRIGVTGNSGGGTMTTWLTGVERRWTMSAPSCFVTSFLNNLENELPADTEQCPPGALARHLDHEDFLAAMAPEPVIILAKEQDFFDVRGSEEAYQRLQHLYGLLGAKENVGLFVGPTPHGYSQENREAMYGWFLAAASGADMATVKPVAEPKIKIEADEDLWCTPRGQVAELDGTRTVFDFTREKSQQLRESRSELSAAALQAAVRRLLKIRPASEPPRYRILRYLSSRGYPKPQAMSYAVESEPGVFALSYILDDVRRYSRPRRAEPNQQAILYVSHHSSDVELREEELLRETFANAAEGSLLVTCDVRGTGESQPDTCGINSYLSPYGSDYFYAIHSLMLDRPYVGQKTFDVLRVIDWLADHGWTDVHLMGRGWGALSATFAAVLHDNVKQVTLKNALTSYADIAESKEYAWPLSTFAPNVLAEFDLPDCYRALEAKGLTQLDPWGATGPNV